MTEKSEIKIETETEIESKNETKVPTRQELSKILTKEEFAILCDKETEAPYSGEYNDMYELDGIWVCRSCSFELFDAQDKYKSGCGWPSFKSSKTGAVKRTLDADGSRVEITCANCTCHLGHVFVGERQTETNTRHCVNSKSLRFVKNK